MTTKATFEIIITVHAEKGRDCIVQINALPPPPFHVAQIFEKHLGPAINAVLADISGKEMEYETKMIPLPKTERN